MRGGAAHTVTCNLDALLLENEVLRHQVRLLREELAMLQGRASANQAASGAGGGAWGGEGRGERRADRGGDWRAERRGDWRQRSEGRRHPAAEDPFARWSGRGERGRSWRAGPEVTTGAAPGITPQLVRQWGEALERHPRWRELRLGSRLEGDPAAGGTLEFGLQALQIGRAHV